MITFGFGTMAMLTYGLGNALRKAKRRYVMSAPPDVSFVEKPWGINIEEETGPISFGDREIEIKEK